MIVSGLDIETTGLLDPEHRIIEICILLYDLDSQKKLGGYTKRIHPQRSITPKAQEVHGITIHDLAGCPTWDEVASMVARIMSKSDLIVAHNGYGFDLPFIANELVRVGIALPDVQGFDTMLEGRWATPMGKQPSLAELCFATGVEYDPAKAHGAEYDVEVMMAAFFKGVEKGFFKIPQTEEQKEAA